MATATIKPKSFNRQDSQRRIRHPLQSLRGYIRAYVLLEGVAIALLFVAVCFWALLIFDFGLFVSPLHMDWVKWLDLTFLSQASAASATEAVSPPVVSFWVRTVLLALFAVCLVAVVLWKVLGRLFSEFSDSSLALVLERRFPNQLGDRLITAVELANPKLADTYGYSQEMVDHTVRAAAERVQRLPVRGVFNWSRLWGHWLLAIGCSVGVLGGIMACFAGLGTVQDRTSFDNYLTRFTRTGSILLKRNVLLMDRVYWPTRSYVEIVRFQASQAFSDNVPTMRVARDEERKPIEARAFEYVIYDNTSKNSIRPLRFADLKGWVDDELLKINLPDDWRYWAMNIDDLDPSVPGTLIPQHWHDGAMSGDIRDQLETAPVKPEVSATAVGLLASQIGNATWLAGTALLSPEDKRSTMKELFQLAKVDDKVNAWLNWRTWTMDRLKHQLARQQVRRIMREEYKDAEAKLDKIFAAIDELAAAPESNWDIRKLKIPHMVYMYYAGAQTKSFSPVDKVGENRYHIGLNELKESVNFYVQGENFYTLPRRIELVPPPSLSELLATVREPAYLSFWLSKNQQPLKGQKRLHLRVPQSLTGPITRISVMKGSDLELVSTIDPGGHKEEGKKRQLKDGIRLAAPEVPKLPETKQTKKEDRVPPVSVELDDNKRTFRIRLENVQKTYEFEFRFIDTDNVKGKRHIIIEPTDDERPEEAVGFELAALLRKPRIKGITTSEPSSIMEAFLITPDAALPFKGTMKDTHGLTSMKWLYDYKVVDFELVGEKDLKRSKKPGEEPKRYLAGPVRRATYVASGFHNLPNPFAPAWFTHPVFYWKMGVDRYVRADLKASKSALTEGSFAMKEFAKDMQGVNANAWHEQQFLKYLADQKEFEKKYQQYLKDLAAYQKLPPSQAKEAGAPKRPKAPVVPPLPLPKVHSVEDEKFDVGIWLSDKLKPADKYTEHQLHYQLRVYIAAEDNNLEAAKPGYRRSKVPVSFLIISERELIAQILIEEEQLRDQFKKAIDKLRDAEKVLEGEIDKLNGASPPLFTMDDRVKDSVLDHVQEKMNVAQEVLDSFRRIHKEMEINRVDQVRTFKSYQPKKQQNRVREIRRTIIEPLNEVTQPKGLFEQTEEEVLQLLKGINDDLALIKKLKKDQPAKLQTLLQNHQPEHLVKAEKARESLKELIVKLDDVLQGIGGELSFNRIVAQAVDMERIYRRNVISNLREMYHKKVQDIVGEIQ